jgi:hypothetical protein
MGEINTIITNILNLATGLGVAVCALYMAIAGYNFMTSGGSSGGVEKSKSAAFNAAIGLALVLSARVIANLVQSTVTAR